MELVLERFVLLVSFLLLVEISAAARLKPLASEQNVWLDQFYSYYSSSGSYMFNEYSSSSDDDVNDWEGTIGPREAKTASTDTGEISQGQHGFLKLDQNKDGYVTKHEYSLRNPDVDVEMVRTLFEILDSDGDEKLTEKELINKTDFWETSQDCEVFAMQQCDGRLTYTVELSEEPTDQEAMCQGLQAYLDCLSSESTFCDFSGEFVQAVYTFADSYKNTGLCENLIIKGLARFGESENSSRRRRFTPAVTERPTAGAQLECVMSQLTVCSSLFNRSLREAGTFCATLSEYRHCVNHAAMNCKDEKLVHLKEGVRSLVHVHRKFKICDFH